MLNISKWANYFEFVIKKNAEDGQSDQKRESLSKLFNSAILSNLDPTVRSREEIVVKTKKDDRGVSRLQSKYNQISLLFVVQDPLIKQLYSALERLGKRFESKSYSYEKLYDDCKFIIAIMDQILKPGYIKEAFRKNSLAVAGSKLHGDETAVDQVSSHAYNQLVDFKAAFINQIVSEIENILDITINERFSTRKQEKAKTTPEEASINRFATYYARCLGLDEKKSFHNIIPFLESYERSLYSRLMSLISEFGSGISEEKLPDYANRIEDLRKDIKQFLMTPRAQRELEHYPRQIRIKVDNIPKAYPSFNLMETRINDKQREVDSGVLDLTVEARYIKEIERDRQRLEHFKEMKAKEDSAFDSAPFFNLKQKLLPDIDLRPREEQYLEHVEDKIGEINVELARTIKQTEQLEYQVVYLNHLMNTGKIVGEKANSTKTKLVEIEKTIKELKDKKDKLIEEKKKMMKIKSEEKEYQEVEDEDDDFYFI
ncbi:MAG: hypothetical protein LC122_12865 [Chitinophagales bacterium]|nr:hypothetical protein [Chitinophagales bacterium]